MSRPHGSPELPDLIARASDGILTMLPGGIVTTWNPAMEELTGYSAEEVLGGGGFAMLEPRGPDEREVRLERWADPGATLPPEVQVVTKGGHLKWLSCSYSLAAESDGTGDSLVAMARDVTRTREMQRIRDEFVAMVSHELRAPLSPIKGWATTLLQFGDTLEPEERRAAIQSILRQSQRLERLTASLLEVSKIEHGILDAASADVEISAVVRRIVDDFEKMAPDRVFTVDAAGTFLARARELWVEQIVTNLVSNAVKYSGDAEPINLSVDHRDGQIQVAVADHGYGIPADELDRVFERFHRVREAATQTGAGLGLYIARQLAQQMDGTISVESVLGHGSTFVLTLPAVARLVDVRRAEIVGL